MSIQTQTPSLFLSISLSPQLTSLTCPLTHTRARAQSVDSTSPAGVLPLFRMTAPARVLAARPSACGPGQLSLLSNGRLALYDVSTSAVRLRSCVKVPDTYDFWTFAAITDTPQPHVQLLWAPDGVFACDHRQPSLVEVCAYDAWRHTAAQLRRHCRQSVGGMRVMPYQQGTRHRLLNHPSLGGSRGGGGQVGTLAGFTAACSLETAGQPNLCLGATQGHLHVLDIRNASAPALSIRHDVHNRIWTMLPVRGAAGAEEEFDVLFAEERTRHVYCQHFEMGQIPAETVQRNTMSRFVDPVSVQPHGLPQVLLRPAFPATTARTHTAAMAAESPLLGVGAWRLRDATLAVVVQTSTGDFFTDRFADCREDADESMRGALPYLHDDVFGPAVSREEEARVWEQGVVRRVDVTSKLAFSIDTSGHDDAWTVWAWLHQTHLLTLHHRLERTRREIGWQPTTVLGLEGYFDLSELRDKLVDAMQDATSSMFVIAQALARAFEQHKQQHQKQQLELGLSAEDPDKPFDRVLVPPELCCQLYLAPDTRYTSLAQAIADAQARKQQQQQQTRKSSNSAEQTRGRPGGTTNNTKAISSTAQRHDGGGADANGNTVLYAQFVDVPASPVSAANIIISRGRSRDAEGRPCAVPFTLPPAVHRFSQRKPLARIETHNDGDGDGGGDERRGEDEKALREGRNGTGDGDSAINNDEVEDQGHGGTVDENDGDDGDDDDGGGDGDGGDGDDDDDDAGGSQDLLSQVMSQSMNQSLGGDLLSQTLSQQSGQLDSSLYGRGGMDRGDDTFHHHMQEGLEDPTKLLDRPISVDDLLQVWTLNLDDITRESSLEDLFPPSVLHEPVEPWPKGPPLETKKKKKKEKKNKGRRKSKMDLLREQWQQEDERLEKLEKLHKPVEEEQETVIQDWFDADVDHDDGGGDGGGGGEFEGTSMERQGTAHDIGVPSGIDSFAQQLLSARGRRKNSKKKAGAGSGHSVPATPSRLSQQQPSMTSTPPASSANRKGLPLPSSSPLALASSLSSPLSRQQLHLRLEGGQRLQRTPHPLRNVVASTPARAQLHSGIVASPIPAPSMTGPFSSPISSSPTSSSSHGSSSSKAKKEKRKKKHGKTKSSSRSSPKKPKREDEG